MMSTVEQWLFIIFDTFEERILNVKKEGKEGICENHPQDHIKHRATEFKSSSRAQDNQKAFAKVEAHNSVENRVTSSAQDPKTHLRKI